MTGPWLLASHKFKMWLNTNNHTLLCWSIPGARRTALMSVVVDYLRTSFGIDESIGIAYLYCDYKLRNQQKANELLKGLLVQLVQCYLSIYSTAISMHSTKAGEPFWRSFSPHSDDNYGFRLPRLST